MVFLFSILLALSIIGLIVLSIGYFLYDINIRNINQEKNKKDIRTEEELMYIVYSLLERKWRYRVQFQTC